MKRLGGDEHCKGEKKFEIYMKSPQRNE